jgi:hypothetical protein
MLKIHKINFGLSGNGPASRVLIEYLHAQAVNAKKKLNFRPLGEHYFVTPPLSLSRARPMAAPFAPAAVRVEVVVFVERGLPTNNLIQKPALCVRSDVNSSRKHVCLFQPMSRASRHFGQRQNLVLGQHLTKLIRRAVFAFCFRSLRCCDHRSLPSHIN